MSYHNSVHKYLCHKCKAEVRCSRLRDDCPNCGVKGYMCGSYKPEWVQVPLKPENDCWAEKDTEQ